MLKAKIERKLSKSKKIEKSRFLELRFNDFNQIWGEASGPPHRRLCQFLQKFRSGDNGRRSAKKFSLWGLTPKFGEEILRTLRESVAPAEYYRKM